MAVLIPRAEPIAPTVPGDDQVVTLGAVRAGVLRHDVLAALFVGGFLDKRGFTHLVDHAVDSLTTDPADDGPSTVKVRWPASDRVRHLFVALRVQTSRAKGGDPPELVVRLLRASDNAEIDKGCSWPRASLLVERDPDAERYQPFWVQSGARVVPASDQLTGPRLLNVGANQEEWLVVEVTADSARVLAVYVCEWPEALVPQAFNA